MAPVDQDPNLIPAGNDVQRDMSMPKLNTITAPESGEEQDAEVHYHCTVLNASMHRKDGTRIGFVQGHHATKVKSSIRYLNEEIDNGNPTLSRATKDQIYAYKMMRDPRGTIENDLRGRLEAEIRAKILAEMSGEIVPDEKPPGQKDGAKIGGVDPMDKLKGLVNKPDTIKSGTASVIMQSQAAPIKPVSSADIADGAAPSGR